MSKSGNGNPSSDLQDRREAIGLSREGMAFKAGVSLRTIERIEAGEVEPRRATLAVIEAVLADQDREEAKA